GDQEYWHRHGPERRTDHYSSRRPTGSAPGRHLPSRHRTHPDRPARFPRSALSRSGGGGKRRLDGTALRADRDPFEPGETVAGAGRTATGAARQLALRLGRVGPQLALRQLHALARGIVPGDPAVGGSPE